MKLSLKPKLQSGLLVLTLLTGITILPAKADYYDNNGQYNNYANNGQYYNYNNAGQYSGYANNNNGYTFTQAHPYATKAAIAGGIGAVAGGLLGGGLGGAIKGALVGGAAGTGYEYLRQRGTFSRFGF